MHRQCLENLRIINCTVSYDQTIIVLRLIEQVISQLYKRDVVVSNMSGLINGGRSANMRFYFLRKRAI